MKIERKIKLSVGFNVFVFILINWGIRIIEIKLLKTYGIESGGLFAFITSLITRYIIILIYDYQKVDRLRIEHIKLKYFLNQEVTDTSSVTRKMMRYKNRSSNYLLIMLIFGDPVLTVLFYRPGYFLWNNMPDRKTFFLFVISVIIGIITITTLYYFFGGSLWNFFRWLFNLIF